MGLGKTIEAGRIWTGPKARYDASRLLVVCPATLREQWCYELETKFGAEPRVVDAAGAGAWCVQPTGMPDGRPYPLEPFRHLAVAGFARLREASLGR